MSDKDKLVENLGGAITGALMVASALAKYRDEQEGGSEWRETFEVELIKDAKSTQMQGLSIEREMAVYECIFGGIKVALAKAED